MKIEFGLKRNNNFIALLGKGACSRLTPSKLHAGPEEGVGWGLVYGEREGLAGFDRNCVCAASLVCHVFRVVLGSLKIIIILILIKG